MINNNVSIAETIVRQACTRLDRDYNLENGYITTLGKQGRNLFIGINNYAIIHRPAYLPFKYKEFKVKLEYE